jgi:hypothetical protein
VLQLLAGVILMVSVISKEKKKPYLLLGKYAPVLLTAKYPEYYEQLIEYALNRQITLCCRTDILSANDIRISEDFQLSPAQIIQILQEKPKPVTLHFHLPEHLITTEQLKTIETKVAINGLFINSIEADNLVPLIEEKLSKIQENKSSIRQDIISNAVIDCILPALFPNKTLNLSANEKNKLKFKCFEMLKSTLEKGGYKIIYKKMGKKDASYIQVQEKDGTFIRTTFEAFRKRFDGIFKSYLEKMNS